MGAGLTIDRDQLLDRLVRYGRLEFADFLLLDPAATECVLADPAASSDWSLALSNAPHILLHFRRAADPQSEMTPSLSAIHAAQARLVHRFAWELLSAKAPPLCDALPWNDWNFSIVARRFKLWQTRFLLAGDGTSVTMARCRKSAGVIVLEPNPRLARYIEHKAALDKVKHLRVLPSSLHPSIPLPSLSVDLAILGSGPSLQPGENQGLSPGLPKAGTAPVLASLLDSLARVSRSILLIENNPLAPPLEEPLLRAAGFTPDTVEVRELGPRRCWWR